MANIPWQTIGTVLYYIILPILWLLRGLWYVVRAIYSTLRHASNTLLLPVRFLARFETLYIYYGTAIIVGVATGLLLYVTAKTITTIFGINQPREPPGRTVASYRAEKAEKQAKKARYNFARMAMPLRKDGGVMAEYKDTILHDRSPGGGLMSTTILEEDDSSEPGYL